MKKTLLKVGFDIIMTVLMLVTMAYTLTGGYLHELLGLIVVAMFILHNLFNIKWICNVTRKVFTASSDYFNAVKYIVNMLMLILFIAVGASGTLISESFFTNISALDRALWVAIHNISAYSLFICISVHIGLHWNLIMTSFRKMFDIKGESKPRKLVLRILAFCMALLGIKANIDKDFTKHFTLPKSEEVSQQKQLDETPTTTQTKITAENTNAQYASLSLELTRGHGEATYDFSSNPPGDNESEEDYLGRLNCTGCGKRCLLTNPQCNTGASLAQQAVEYYNSNASYSDDTNEDNNTSGEINADNDAQNPQTDNDYLSNLFCTGCGKHCPLSNPQCATGVRQAEQALAEYNAQSDDKQTEESPNDSGSDSTVSEKSESENKSDDSSEISNDNSSQSDVPTLEEYLGGLTCTGCGRQCLLTNPQCNKGEVQAQTAATKYNELYAYKSEQVDELIFEGDQAESLKEIFTTMIPVMSLYVAGTHYLVKFARRKKKQHRKQKR